MTGIINEYNGQNRMAYSDTVDRIGNDRIITEYDYDGFGRRTIVQDTGYEAMRTVYDGLSFEVLREGVTFRDGSLTTKLATGIVRTEERTPGIRYRYLGPESQNGQLQTRRLTETTSSLATRFTGINATLYGNGEAVAINRLGNAEIRGGTSYLGKDALGSVRSRSDENGQLEDRYEFDAFGKPYKGDLNSGMNLGYTGKPYDTTTGMYNYGYRDYQPEMARFTTIDPIRDGANWFAYVNNDPVNYIDLWGLDTVYFYEDHRVLDDPRAGIYIDGTTTHYASSEETITQHKEKSMDDFIKGPGGSFRQSEDDPENSFEYNQYGAKNKVTFSPVKSAELPPGMPSPPKGGVASRDGSAEQNGFKIGCGK